MQVVASPFTSKSSPLLERKITVLQTCGCQGGGGGSGMDGEFGGSRCRLLHWEWRSHEILRYSTGNCI